LTAPPLSRILARMPGPWWKNGIRFECQMSGRCCVSRGEYGHVYLTRADRRRLATHFGLTVREFVKAYCRRSAGIVELVDPPGATCCRFFADGRCDVYDARPTQCRTWPFWPEVMRPRAWAAEVAAYCPGVGKGPVVPVEEIRAALDVQRRANDEIEGPAR
jgi:uncharacterized protein